MVKKRLQIYKKIQSRRLLTPRHWFYLLLFHTFRIKRSVGICILEKANHFLPRSFSDAPM